MLYEAASSEWFSNSLSFIGDLSAQNMILFNKISQSRFKSLNFFIFLNDCLYNISSVHTLSYQSWLSLICILVSFRDFFESSFESYVLLFFCRGKITSNSNKFFLNTLKSLSKFFVFSLLGIEFWFSDWNFSSKFLIIMLYDLFSGCGLLHYYILFSLNQYFFFYNNFFIYWFFNFDLNFNFNNFFNWNLYFFFNNNFNFFLDYSINIYWFFNHFLYYLYILSNRFNRYFN